MARIAGVNLPAKKRIEVALTYINGIGSPRARDILARTGVDRDTRVMDLTEQEVTALRREVEAFTVEGDLRRQVRAHVGRLQDIGCYRGLRHRTGLPVRGQKTQSNARTWKGPRPAKAGKKR
ncbi:MAG: 30S ribosomal protein S13 [Candidatus Bipolaricaulaceae bacterium]